MAICAKPSLAMAMEAAKSLTEFLRGGGGSGANKQRERVGKEAGVRLKVGALKSWGHFGRTQHKKKGRGTCTHPTARMPRPMTTSGMRRIFPKASAVPTSSLAITRSQKRARTKERTK